MAEAGVGLRSVLTRSKNPADYHEATGDWKAALPEFENAHAVDVTLDDVEEQIEKLRKNDDKAASTASG